MKGKKAFLFFNRDFGEIYGYGETLVTEFYEQLRDIYEDELVKSLDFSALSSYELRSFRSKEDQRRSIF